MEFEDIIFEQSNHIATITLNNPVKLNALTEKMMPELSQALDIVRNDDDIRDDQNGAEPPAASNGHPNFLHAKHVACGG